MDYSILVSLLAVHGLAILFVAIFSGPGRFNITSITVEAGRDLINVTFAQVSRVTTYIATGHA